MVDINAVREAGNKIIADGGKITVANIRRKLIELFGYAGNNNDLAPLVKEYKSNIRTQSRGNDIDVNLANSIQQALQKNMPANLEASSSKFINLMYKEIYEAVESEISIDRIEQLEMENTIFRNQIKDYPKLKMKYDLLEQNYQDAMKELVETNRLLDMQKVATGEQMVEEHQRINNLYEEATNEIANLKATAEFATQRKNEFSHLNAELRENVDEKNNRIVDLEEALLQMSNEQSTVNSSKREKTLENRVVEMAKEIEKMQQEKASKLSIENLLHLFFEREGLNEEIEKNRSKFAKNINKLFDFILESKNVNQE